MFLLIFDYRKNRIRRLLSRVTCRQETNACILFMYSFHINFIHIENIFGSIGYSINCDTKNVSYLNH